MRFNYKPSVTISLNLLLILTVSSCASNSDMANNSNKESIYQYKHQCAKKGKPVEHFVEAKTPLSLKELAQLKPTLEENLGLDYNSCYYIGDLK